ncbi:hypothetical protein SETIT_3G320800v2 [Setaria italica]|uniref:ATP-dependent DNA helicase n=1 Tax=Setaria italica TaxID=4555 RepID=K3ZCX7_SETIT|nr:hypothetical protein SETIT_3G320800v2 [Setaria italica]
MSDTSWCTAPYLGLSKPPEQLVLRDISFHLKSMGKDIRHYGLPELNESEDLRTRDHYRELIEEQNLGYEEEHLVIIDTLNVEQRAEQGQGFFVDGPGSTGKIYLYNALLSKVRSMGLIAVAMATSGIASSIMLGGHTTHSRFKIPIKLDNSTMCSFTKQSGIAELLWRASLIIWDEVMVTKRQCVLPIVAHGTRAQITVATLLKSCIWESVRRIRLTQNMRAQSNTWFADYLLSIGNGTEETFGDEYRAILSTRNEHVDAVNALMIYRFPGTKQVYYSFASIEDDTRNNYPLDFLNTKRNCPVILLRNLDPHNGLCNGTRLIVRGFQKNCIDAEIVNGQHAGKRVFIPRIPMSPSEDLSLPFKFKRKQFPIRLSFAMTINKA